MRRIALKFAYDGLPFYGYARQPNLETVEGNLIHALKKNKFITDVRSAVFQSASRTDKGVSALGNVVAFNTVSSLETVVRRLSDEFRDIYVYSSTIVDDDFYPRHADQRRYRYFIPKMRMNREAIEEILAFFQGTHDFSNFARIEAYKNPLRTIEMISVNEKDSAYEIEISAQTFLWQQIRRMISCIIKVEKNKITKDDVVYALNHPEKSIDFGVVSAEPLILVDIEYNQVKFEKNEKGEKIKEAIEERVKERVKGLVY